MDKETKKHLEAFLRGCSNEELAEFSVSSLASLVHTAMAAHAQKTQVLLGKVDKETAEGGYALVSTLVEIPKLCLLEASRRWPENNGQEYMTDNGRLAAPKDDDAVCLNFDTNNPNSGDEYAISLSLSGDGEGGDMFLLAVWDQEAIDDSFHPDPILEACWKTT